jgi:hypothetical protein
MIKHEQRNSTYEINELHEGYKIGKSKCKKEHRGLGKRIEKYALRRHDTLCTVVQIEKYAVR